MRKGLLFILFVGFIIACSGRKDPSSEHPVYELEIVDSIQVKIDDQITSLDFSGGIGAAYGIKTRVMFVFDSTGTVLLERAYPQEGPGSIGYVVDVKVLDSGEILAYAFHNPLILLSRDLEIKQLFKLPFPSELQGAAYYRPLMDVRNEQVYVFFPGRDEGRPYFNDFFKKHHILEKLNLKTGDSEPFLKLPAMSKYYEDLTYEYATVTLSINGDLLYLALDTEAFVHVFDVNTGEHKSTLDFEPEKFLQKEGSKEMFVSSYGEFMRGEIKHVFALKDGVAVLYHEGIDRDIFQQEQLLERENWYKQPDYNKAKLKVYNNDSGWSNEITVPAKVQTIAGFTDPTKSFWGLRNDEYVNAEEEFLTFYKMRLRRK